MGVGWGLGERSRDSKEKKRENLSQVLKEGCEGLSGLRELHAEGKPCSTAGKHTRV